MAVPFEVPLAPENRIFTIPLAGVIYGLRIIWRASGPTRMPPSNTAETDGTWVLDITDAQGAPVVSGIPLVTGIDLLAPYAYLGLGGSLVVQTDGDPGATPTFGNLGQASHLYFIAND